MHTYILVLKETDEGVRAKCYTPEVTRAKSHREMPLKVVVDFAQIPLRDFSEKERNLREISPRIYLKSLPRCVDMIMIIIIMYTLPSLRIMCVYIYIYIQL